MRVVRLKSRSRSRLLTLGLVLIGLSTAAEVLTPQNIEEDPVLTGEPRTVETIVATRSGTCPNTG
jgi:hypothetical protein